MRSTESKLLHSHVWHVLFWQQPGIILLKEGTDASQGVPQLISNINACQFIADAVRTTLGPRGMDKLIVNSQGRSTVQYTPVVQSMYTSEETVVLHLTVFSSWSLCRESHDFQWRCYNYKSLRCRPSCGKNSCRYFKVARRGGVCNLLKGYIYVVFLMVQL